jgi:hypothetical protein
MNDVIDLRAVETAETSVASMALAVNEVAEFAADSTFPVAALQYLIDGVHSFTGLNWWACIAVTTILAHGMITPILIHRYKAKENMEVRCSAVDSILWTAQPSFCPYLLLLCYWKHGGKCTLFKNRESIFVFYRSHNPR